MSKVTYYRGHAISYNLYGKGEYTVQDNEGDDVWFYSISEAHEFIDEMVEEE